MTDLAAGLEQTLRRVVDPETGRDLIAMGMIYEARIAGTCAHVTMTTTTRGCPLTEMLRLGVEAALLAMAGIETAEVRLTWDPAWTPERMEPLSL
ncbi:metal-sulfur cluster assembly factor [Paracoccus sp. IB05]|uniref:metal-sulfur cluster assembly factor n=1 Tax=Paracoccus sp. IB05 TaxID=2779367 RepID=UPI0018E6E4D3|nr:metal-sulfur cluster assembly factor [Paracoccus sp. IB05]MBJ2153140.1 metal-sulfur cluster assembly factor [Paracoccus sp. IB05]